jgi:acyl dehydratase
MTAQRGWWLEDAVPGIVIRHADSRTITADEHVPLAWVTHNVSDIHGNHDAASHNAWGEPLVLGALTAAIVIGLAAPASGPPRTALAATSGGWHSIRLEATVRAGDTVRAESRIESIVRVDADGGYVRRTVLGRNQYDQVVARIEDEAYAPRRPVFARTSNVSGGVSNV